MNKTIEDIVEDMREFADRRDFDSYGSMDVAHLRFFALLIEAACHQPVTDCNVLGNAARMREALETISKCDISKEEDCYTLYRECEEALAASPRNCDILSKDEVLEMLKDRSFSKEDIIEWLYAEAKGGTDGSK